MAEVIFFIAAFGALAGAIGVIWDWDPFYNVLSLVVHLISLAALFLLLRSEFLAAAQVVIYAGAVMVLYVFVVAYVGRDAATGLSLGPSLRPVAGLFVAVVLVELVIALTGTGLKALDTEGAPFDPEFGSPGQIGQLLLTKFLMPFELASFLLLVAAVGAVVLARRRRGTVPEGEDTGAVYSVMDALRPAGTGTMKEAVSGIPHAEGQPVGTHPDASTRPEIAAAGTRAGSEADEERGW